MRINTLTKFILVAVISILVSACGQNIITETATASAPTDLERIDTARAFLAENNAEHLIDGSSETFLDALEVVCQTAHGADGDAEIFFGALVILAEGVVTPDEIGIFAGAAIVSTCPEHLSWIMLDA